MNREELIKALKDWKPELELLAKYNDNSIDYQRYRALDETIKALEQLPEIKEVYDKGYKDGQKALAVHLELCEEEGSVITAPEGATNGDMVKTMFPSASETDHFILNSPIGNIIYIRLEEYQEMRVQEEWWNSPYRKEQE